MTSYLRLGFGISLSFLKKINVRSRGFTLKRIKHFPLMAYPATRGCHKDGIDLSRARCNSSCKSQTATTLHYNSTLFFKILFPYLGITTSPLIKHTIVLLTIRKKKKTCAISWVTFHLVAHNVISYYIIIYYSYYYYNNLIIKLQI